MTRVLLREERRREGILEFTLSGPADPRGVLKELLDLYKLGRRVPLLFFPEQASDYLDRLARGKKEEAEILRDFRKDFGEDGSQGSRPEIRLLYGGDFPLEPGYSHFPGDPGPSFQDLADRILGPFLGARGEGSDG